MLSHATTLAAVISQVYSAPRHREPTEMSKRPASSARYEFKSWIAPGTIPPPSIHSCPSADVIIHAAAAVEYCSLFEYEVVRLKETEAAKDQIRLLSKNQQNLELENKKLQRFLKQMVGRLETAENESLACNIAAPMVSPLLSKNKNTSPSASPALQLSPDTDSVDATIEGSLTVVADFDCEPNNSFESDSGDQSDSFEYTMLIKKQLCFIALLESKIADQENTIVGLGMTIEDIQSSIGTDPNKTNSVTTTNGIAFATPAKFAVTPFAVTEIDVQNRRNEEKVKVTVDKKDVFLSKTVADHYYEVSAECGFQAACFETAGYWEDFDTGYILYGKEWDHPLSTIELENTFPSPTAAAGTQIVVSHLQFAPFDGRDRDKNGQFVNTTLNRVQQMLEVLYDVATDLAKEVSAVVQCKDPTHSHVIIDAVDGFFPCDYTKKFMEEYLTLSNKLYLLKLKAIEKVYDRFGFKVTGMLFFYSML